MFSKINRKYLSTGSRRMVRNAKPGSDLSGTAVKIFGKKTVKEITTHQNNEKRLSIKFFRIRRLFDRCSKNKFSFNTKRHDKTHSSATVSSAIRQCFVTI
jgi:hypothetical protein